MIIKKRTDTLHYIEMPNPNPDNEYVNCLNQMQPAIHIASEELRTLYEALRTRLLRLLELQVEMFFSSSSMRKRRSFPCMQDMTGEWYIGEITMCEKREPSAEKHRESPDENHGGEKRMVYGCVLTRFLGNNPSKDKQNPILDYLGIVFSFHYDVESDQIIFDLRSICRLYMERPELFETNVPKDSILCPDCHAAGYDMEKYWQAVTAGKKVLFRKTLSCKTCGGYGYVSPQGERISFWAKQKALMQNFFRLVFIPVFLPGLSLMAGILLLYLSLHPMVLDVLTSGGSSALDLLAGYSQWYFLLMVLSGAGGLIIAIGGAISLRHIFSLRSFRFVVYPLRTMTTFMVVMFLGFYGLFAALMLPSEKVPDLWRQSQEDIARIEEGELEQITVWLSPKSRPSRFLGPYTKGQPERMTRYSGIGEQTGRQWVWFYIPDCLDFSLDQDALYNENRSISWNVTYARQYEITYTPNLHVVVSISPVGPL